MKMYTRITEDRSSPTQSMCDIRLEANTRGLSEQEAKIARACYDFIPHYRMAAKSMARTRYYIRANYDYGATLFYWNGEEVEHIATTSKHRIGVIQSAHENGDRARIPADIWANYCIGGYTTRKGLYRAAKDSKALDQARRMAQSHMNLGHIEGRAGHDIRVRSRN